ncbi:uncharacterized protein LOC144821591 isoform X2 [Lissotriton helveticus]
MSEASSGGIQTCASQVKIKEIEEASTSDEQIFMARVEVKGDMTTSSDWRDDIQQVVIGEASGSDCQAYESHTKFENRMQTSSNHWGYNQHVIEESEEVAASDPPSYLNPVKIKEGKEAFSHDGQHDMETERVEEASPNEHHASVSHIKLEAEEASFNGFQYHMKLVGIEEGEKASASDRQVCRGLVTTEEVSATGSQDLVSQVTAEEGDELSSMDQPTCLWHIKVEDDDACGIDQPACISQIKIEEEDVSIDEQACMRHIKVEEEAYAIGQQACIKPPMFGKDEAYANDEQTCASHLKMEEQMHAADQQASVSQVKTEGGMECSIRQTPAQDLMGLEECVGMEVEEGPSSVCYQNAIVQLISSKEGEMIGENGRYVLVKLAIAGGNTTSAREQQNLLTQVEMQREKSFVGELKNLVGHSNIDTKADPPGPCKIKKKEGPPCMDFHRPMNQEVAVAEQHTPWHLDEYTVYMDVEEGKEQLVSRDPLVQEGHMPSASPYNSSTVQECQLALSDDHNSSSHKDDEQSSSNECDLEFQDDEDLSDWEYHDWRNFVSNDPKENKTSVGRSGSNRRNSSVGVDIREPLSVKATKIDEPCYEWRATSLSRLQKSLKMKPLQGHKDCVSVLKETIDMLTPCNTRDCENSLSGCYTNAIHSKACEEGGLCACVQCKMSFMHESVYHQQKAMHTGKKQGTDLEAEPYLTGQLSSGELRNGHINMKEHVCAKHGDSFSKEFELTKHQEVHTRRSSSSKPGINSDIVSSVQKFKPNKTLHCDECGKCYTDKKFFLTHCEIHSSEKWHKCHECGKEFRTQKLLNSHLRKHVLETLYTCNICKKGFSGYSQLTAHQGTHAGENVFLCRDCGETFSDVSSFILHHKMHPLKKPYTCTECKKSYSKASCLAIHQLIHVRNKPHQCSECEASFTRASQLRKHQQKHAKKNCFSCSNCGKTYSRLCSLNNHQEISYKSLYTCTECGKRFCYQMHLQKHLKEHMKTGGENTSDSQRLAQRVKQYVLVYPSQPGQTC